jgi:hypothetical protein
VIALLFVAPCFVPYSNDANDNFKGVASLFGSRTRSYKTAISWATITTGTGSIAAIFLAQSLLKWLFSACKVTSGGGHEYGRKLIRVRTHWRKPRSYPRQHNDQTQVLRAAARIFRTMSLHGTASCRSLREAIGQLAERRIRLSKDCERDCHRIMIGGID